MNDLEIISEALKKIADLAFEIKMLEMKNLDSTNYWLLSDHEIVIEVLKEKIAILKEK